MQCLIAWSLTLLAWPAAVQANYRKFGFLNHDLCTREGKGKSLQLGSGAALLSLEKMETAPRSKCSVKIKADNGFGLMVYVEEMNLRRSSSGSCRDYVQFGRDDYIPFITVEKSEKLCGNRSGFSYDEPDGKLLVWLNLGSDRSSEWINRERLTIVITTYKPGTKEVSTNFRLCGRRDRLIRKEYFCDSRVNCALDGEPGDERPDICRHLPGAAGKDNAEGEYTSGEWHPPLNLVSITLVLVSGVVLLVLVLLLVARMRRTGWKCCLRTSNIDCELPERSAAVARGTSGHRGATGGHTRPERQENLYLPLAMYLEPRQDQGQGQRVGTGRGTTPEAEPPPAYHDLFPVGYKFQSEKSEDQPSQLNDESSVKNEDQRTNEENGNRGAPSSDNARDNVVGEERGAAAEVIASDQPVQNTQ